MKDFRDLIIEQIKGETERDKQRLIGPSAMGGCPYCLGRQMAGTATKRPFSFYPKLGTAFHYYMEHHMHIPEMVTEHKVDICEITGYGKISGTIDLWYPPMGIIGDYKLVGKNTMNRVKLDGPSMTYKAQAHVYGYGESQLGHKVEEIHILFVPRDESDIRKLYDWSEPYNEEFALAVIDRTKQVWEYVTGGFVEDLESDKDCYECKYSGRA